MSAISVLVGCLGGGLSCAIGLQLAGFPGMLFGLACFVAGQLSGGLAGLAGIESSRVRP